MSSVVYVQCTSTYVSTINEIFFSPFSSKWIHSYVIAPSTIVQSDTNENESYSIPQIATLIEQRQKFRSTQEWEKADNIRTQLENMGFSVQDSCSGVTSLGKQETKKYVDSKKGDIGADIRRLTKKRNFLQLKHLLETSEEYSRRANLFWALATTW